MDVLAAHRSGLRQFDTRVSAIRDNQWHHPTPDTEWDVTDLVGHLVYEQLWVPSLMAGKTVEEVGDRFDGDVLGDDPRSAWAAASSDARQAFTSAGAMEREVHLSFGTVPAPVYVWQMTIDLVVHAWDLARAISADEEMPNDLVSAVLEQAKLSVDDWQGAGIFDPPIPVPGCTDDLTELLALLGRNRFAAFGSGLFGDKP